MKKPVYLFLLLSMLIGVSVGAFMYFKPHPKLENIKADFELTSEALFKDFEGNEATANEKYLNSLIEVAGTVREISTTDAGGYTLILGAETDMFGVSCAFEPTDSKDLEEIREGMEITVKGICSGMLMDVNLNRCILIP
ncbi:MAG: hypothetical protein AAF694_13525 [Bacteroidota bacterium]